MSDMTVKMTEDPVSNRTRVQDALDRAQYGDRVSIEGEMKVDRAVHMPYGVRLCGALPPLNMAEYTVKWAIP